MRKAIVTGGAGFIGSNLVEFLLQSDFQVVVVDNFSSGNYRNISSFASNIKLVVADISVPGAWQSEFKNVDVVFHLAALADIVPSIKNPASYFQSNVGGTLNVLEASRSLNVKKLIYAASSSCYGIPKEYPTNENYSSDPKYPYALTKFLGEQMVLHWAKVYGLPAISTRFFNVYGKNSRTTGTYGALFGIFLAQKLANKPFTIVGDGTQTRDFTFVADVCGALLAVANFGRIGDIYNIGSGRTVSVNRIVELLGGGERVYIPKRPGEPDCTFADIEKIKSHTGWEPTISIEDGIQILLNQIEDWRDAPVWDQEAIKVETQDWFKYLA